MWGGSNGGVYCYREVTADFVRLAIVYCGYSGIAAHNPILHFNYSAIAKFWWFTGVFHRDFVMARVELHVLSSAQIWASLT